ncbi:hypothetical protein FRC11_008189 [Ceratobasidium sp. 423]|nr:hypothetical protein FRC11_008189 [Ceratobasidium sp. 423]
MARATLNNSTIDQLTYALPPLPDYLSKAYSLQTIHFSVGRAPLSEGDDRVLSPFKENIYTPPSLPPHISISLQPIVGVPSDEELEPAHKVVRAMENLANTRYLQDSTQGNFALRLAKPSTSRRSSEVKLPVVTPGLPGSTKNLRELRDPPDPEEQQRLERLEEMKKALQKLEELEEAQDMATTAPDSSAPITSQVPPPDHPISEPNSIHPSSITLDRLCAAQEETNRLLGGNENLLKDIRRTLVSTQKHHFPNSRNSHTKMNKDGELPWMYGLPYVSSNGSAIYQKIPVQQLVAYLRFYDIDAGLIEGNGTGSLKPGMESEANRRLGNFVYYGHVLSS